MTALLLCMILLVAAPTEAMAEDDAPAPAVASAAGSLTVYVTGLRSAKGKGAFALYDSQETFRARSDAVSTAVRDIANDTCEWTVEGLPPGDYAVAFYHDRNGNGELDRNKLGIPREPYGFSRDARGAFGPPSFKEARVIYDGGDAELTFEAR